jgi:WD40 repeat protein
MADLTQVGSREAVTRKLLDELGVADARTLSLMSLFPPERPQISSETAGAVKFLLALTSSGAIQPPDINAVEKPPLRYRIRSQITDETKSSWERFIGLVKEGATLLRYDDEVDMNEVFDVTFAPDGSTLAAAMGDKTVRLWRVADGMLLSTLKGHRHKVTGVAYSPQGTTLASGSLDGTILLWSLPDNTQCRRLGEFGQYNRFADFAEEQKTVNVVQWSPNGQLIAGGYGDGKVRLWRATDGELLFVLEGHKDHVYDLPFSRDSRTLASVATDQNIHRKGKKLF